CKTDDAIRKMAEKGGVMGITGVRNFVSPKEPTTIETLLDHFDYVTKLVGVEHVGVGSDYDLDGYDAMPDDYKKWLRGLYKPSYGFRDKMDTDGFNHYKRMFGLTDGLIRRRYSDADIELILGGKLVVDLVSMKALVFHKPGHVEVNDVAYPKILDPQDVIVRVTSTAICG